MLNKRTVNRSQMQTFSDIIIQWYNKHKRDLPWRKTSDAYYIWLSEIILQQTQVKQGLPYYLKFVKHFPSVKHLAKASEEKVLRNWQGLGYYSRARNLHHTAIEIVKKHNHKFPETFEELLKLKGIGRYTAAAIASISFNKPHAVVDGNVYRLLARYAGIKIPTDSAKGRKKFETLANKLLDKKHPGTFNQAMMEIGATVCKPKNPDCDICPLGGGCYALSKNVIDRLPVKQKQQKITNRWFYYLIMKDNKSIILHKRTSDDIWKNLYDFPVIETFEKSNVEAIVGSVAFKKILATKQFAIKKVSSAKVHRLSHQNIHATFIQMELKRLPVVSDKFKKTDLKTIHKLPFPKLIADFLAENL